MVWALGKRKIAYMKRGQKSSYYVIVPKWWAETLRGKGIGYVEIRVEENGNLIIVPLGTEEFEENKVKT